MKTPIARTLALSLLTLSPAVAQAGPPLVCFPMSIGDAPSLPWGGGWHQPRADYDRRRLADDTLAILGPKTRALVRMETLRRAALYASTDPAAAIRLFAALRARGARDGHTREDALAQFDLGYAVEAYRQAVAVNRQAGISLPEDGHALLSAAVAALRPDAEAEYGLALALIDGPSRVVAEEHLRRAAAAAVDGSDLARTLAAHAPLWGGRPATRDAGARR